MCQSMVNIQSPTAEIRRGKKRRRKKKQDENIMVCPITQGDHNNLDLQKCPGVMHNTDHKTDSGVKKVRRNCNLSSQDAQPITATCCKTLNITLHQSGFLSLTVND